MPPAIQDARLMQFSSPLGKDALLIESLRGSEAISRLFQYEAELLADAAQPIDPTQIVGQRVSVGIHLSDFKGTRWVNGIVASFHQSSDGAEFTTYHAHIVPGVWQLTLSSNCRVFQGMTVMDIVKKILGEYSLSLDDHTSGPHKPMDYCTQYSESDFHFISRLLEHHGIAYWFEHSENDNKIVFADKRSAHTDCPLSASFTFAPQGNSHEGGYGASVEDFSCTATMVSGKHTTRDFDFRPYDKHDASDVSSASPFGDNGFETFLYPAAEEGYVKITDKQLSTPDHASLMLEARAVATDAGAEIYSGSSNARSMCAGFTFSLEEHPRGAWNRRYLLTEVTVQADQAPSYRSDHGFSGGYHNTFRAINAELTFKPPILTAKPSIPGPQTALVVVPSGEEQAVDKLGRVCVQFFWDRERQPNKVDNTWVRVAQPWAGSGWGTFFWPRKNDEVIVQFLNGDPDNPVVIGSVYNGVNLPKYQLPDHSLRSGLVTRSSKNGSAQNANELRFEDKKGSEQVFLNAERDMDHRVENDSRRFVGGEDSLIVKSNHYAQIGADSNLEIKGNSAEKIAGKFGLDVGSDTAMHVGGSLSLKVDSSSGEKIGQNYAMDAGQAIYLKAGMTLVLEAGTQISLKAGGSFISIGPSGVAISGSTVLINSGGAAGSGSAPQIASPDAPKAPKEADDGSKGGAM